MHCQSTHRPTWVFLPLLLLILPKASTVFPWALACSISRLDMRYSMATLSFKCRDTQAFAPAAPGGTLRQHREGRASQA